MTNKILKSQTRGRPRKNPQYKLPQISRKLFSQHHAVFYSTCLIYVLEIFHQTKEQKRLGHSQGGFTLYQKLNNEYSFQCIIEDCRQWGMNKILQNQRLIQFIKMVNGCAPKIIFRQILLLVEDILQVLNQQKLQKLQTNEQINEKPTYSSQQQQLIILSAFYQKRLIEQINQRYKYIRFTQDALKQLGFEKYYQHVTLKVDKLWLVFVQIITYTIYCIVNNVQKSKYYHLFFSNHQEKMQQYGLGLCEIVSWQEGVNNIQEKIKQKKQSKQRNQQNFVSQEDRRKQKVYVNVNVSLQTNKKIRFQPILLSNQSDDQQHQCKKKIKK